MSLLLEKVFRPINWDLCRKYFDKSSWDCNILINEHYVAYKPTILLCILFMFIEIKFIHCHSCVMFVMKSMSICIN